MESHLVDLAINFVCLYPRLRPTIGLSLQTRISILRLVHCLAPKLRKFLYAIMNWFYVLIETMMTNKVHIVSSQSLQRCHNSFYRILF